MTNKSKKFFSPLQPANELWQAIGTKSFADINNLMRGDELTNLSNLYSPDNLKAYQKLLKLQQKKGGLLESSSCWF